MKRNCKIVSQDMDYLLSRFGNPQVFKGKSIMVTGFAGFLGFYLCQFFLNALNEGPKSLVLLDNFVVRKTRWVKELEKRRDQVKILNFDVSKDRLETLDLEAPPDYIVHLASVASPSFYRKYPLETIDANVWGLRSLLEYSKSIALEGLLFFSSSEIYGDPSSDAIPTTEEYRGNVSSMGPRACYDEAKRFGETLCYVFSNTHEIPISIVRPFNNFGPGLSVDDRRVPADFAKAVIEGRDLVIHSDGRPTRTFCYVADAMVGYLKALIYGKFDYFNIGADRPEVSVRGLAEIYQQVGKEIMGYRGKINFEESPDEDYLTHNPSRRCPDISKAKQLLGFAPQIPLEEGIRRYLSFLIEERAY